MGVWSGGWRAIRLTPGATQDIMIPSENRARLFKFTPLKLTPRQKRSLEATYKRALARVRKMNGPKEIARRNALPPEGDTPESMF